MKLKNNTQNGLLISIEGIDGSGKSLFTELLCKALKALEFPVIATREPGGTDYAEKIKQLIFSATNTACPKTEYLLFAASRAEHFEKLILPALQNNMIVLSDRMADSSLVYQGYMKGLSLDLITTVNAWAMDNHDPDVIFYLKLSPDTAYKRILQRKRPLTSFEDSKEILEKAYQGFETLIAPKKNVITLDAEQDPETLVQNALSKLLPFLAAIRQL